VLPGEQVGLWGPRSSFQPPVAVDRYVLVADETVLGGVATVLDALPTTTTPVTVVAEVSGDGERVDLPIGAATELIWLRRDGTSGVRPFVDALGSPDPTRTYVWGGGEGAAMERLRAHLRRGGFAIDHVMLSATWWSPPPGSTPDGGG
jgi:NADPH-dependent ferric siderophore reductase